MRITASRPQEEASRAGDVLVLEQRTAAPVHRSQRRQVRSGDVELLAEVPPQRRRHDADGLQQSPAHAQESDLQREPEHELRPAALLDYAAFGRREVEERLDLEGGQLARQALESEAGRVPVVHVFLYPRQEHNNGPKTVNSNRLICLGNPGLSAKTRGRSYRRSWQQNQGNPLLQRRFTLSGLDERATLADFD
jgi:hypothetical protein